MSSVDLLLVPPPPATPPPQADSGVLEHGASLPIAEHDLLVGRDDEDDEDDAPPPPPPPEDETSNTCAAAQFLHQASENRGWLDHGGKVPTSNPFLLHALCIAKQSPWPLDRPARAEQLSSCLENLYFNQQALISARAFRPQQNDTIVCGSFRSGQTPLLQVLASLKQGSFVEKNELLHHVQWIENANAYTIPSDGHRILKTHMSVRSAFGGEVVSSKRTRKIFKIIIMLRDPSDIRLSWFRHLRRVYKKFSDVAPFDASVTPEHFAHIKLYGNDANCSAQFGRGRDYEDFVFEALEAHRANPEQILLCFYEELLLNPYEFVKKVAEFTRAQKQEELDYDLIDTVAQELCERDEDFPGGFFSSTHKRRGSSAQGKRVFSSKAIFRHKDEWKERQSTFASPYASYEDSVLDHSSIVSKMMETHLAYSTASSPSSSTPTSPVAPKRSTLIAKRISLAVRRRTGMPLPAVVSEVENDVPTVFEVAPAADLPSSPEDEAKRAALESLFSRAAASKPSTLHMRKSLLLMRRSMSSKRSPAPSTEGGEEEVEANGGVALFAMGGSSRRNTEALKSSLAAAASKTHSVDPDDTDSEC